MGIGAIVAIDKDEEEERRQGPLGEMRWHLLFLPAWLASFSVVRCAVDGGWLTHRRH
jgi:hypothetical protein